MTKSSGTILDGEGRPEGRGAGTAPCNRDPFAGVEELDSFVQRHPEVTEIDAFIVDVNGHAIGKRLPLSQGRRLFQSGVAFSACAPLLDCRGRGHNPLGIGGSDGDPDGNALPLAGTLSRVPWAKSPTAQVMCAMREFGTREPLWFDQRVILDSVVSQCRSHGIRAVVACELEFYLLDPSRTVQGELKLAASPRTGAAPTRASNLSLESIEERAGFLAQIEAAAAAQGVPLAGAVTEYGVGQYEVNLRHVPDPLLAADHAVLLRRLVRGVARANGMDATFMAKPFKEQPGSGLHVHVSLVDDSENNRFGAAGGEVLLQQAIAGMQSLMFDSIALYAPNFNSFRRFLGPFVPNASSWGHNNRSVAFRIPAASGPDTRIEHRVAGADASPHLVVAAVLAGALHGIRNKLTPVTPAAQGRVPAGRDPSFPRTLWDALERLERSQLLSQYFPQRYLEAYAHVKRGECDALFEDISARELDFYA
jgi:glutamine synthetase